MPGPSPEQVAACRKHYEKERQCEEVNQQQLRKEAMEAGRDIELSILLDSGVIEVPESIGEKLREYVQKRKEADAFRMKQWNEQLKEMRERRKEKSEVGYSGYIGSITTVSGGPGPEVPARPERIQGLGVVLEFKNVGQKTRRLYLQDSCLQSPVRISGPSVESPGGHGWSPTPFRGRGQKYVDLAPGETYLIRLYKTDHPWPVYLTQAGTYQMDLVFTSGWPPHFMSTKKLYNDAMIIAAKPVKFQVELVSQD